MLRVFIIQHGDANPKDIDPERHLSEKGVNQAKRAAEFLKKLPFYPDIILHSEKARSIETAGVISFALGGVRMDVRSTINPNDDIAGLLEELMALKGTGKSIMIVGHQPFLGKLVSALITGDAAMQSVDISNASPLVLVKNGDRYIVELYMKNDYIKARYK
ncbi:MAG TPA: phosphohistidine phosphatase SixA [Spirochaetota bacterium]|nr:phosphohistidine phosphatase SixA [Spirochaetota bacterium]HQP49197.1 phosphohistidine phosphatase SixA [Spirochaetota bacterium]